MRLRMFAFVFTALCALACGDDPNQNGGDASLDAGAPRDAAGLDLGSLPDAGFDAGSRPDLSVADAGASDGASDGGSAAPTTYYVVRHAERDPGVNPPINPEGQMRASRLADALENAGIEEIVTTEFVRGQQTGRPLADRTGIPITVAPIAPGAWPQFAEQVSAWQRAREVPGRTYLMIGHSGGYNSGILRGLGATFDGTRAERYQDLALLIREPDGTVRTAWLQYGGESSLDP